MPQNFLSCNRDQPMFLPPDMRDWLDDDHLAWFVIDAVAELDLEPFFASYRTDGHGAAAHGPQMMVTLIAYTYAVGERSSRGIERRCREDVVFPDLRQPGPRPRDDRKGLAKPILGGPAGRTRLGLALP